MSLYKINLYPPRIYLDGKGEMIMTASFVATRSIRLAGINLCGGNNASIVQNYQRQMNSNLGDKKEEIDHRK